MILVFSGVIVLLSLTIKKTGTLEENNGIAVDLFPRDILLREKSGKNNECIQSKLISTEKEKIVRVKRSFEKFQQRSIVTCDPNSYGIIKSDDIFASGFSVLRVKTKNTTDGFLIEITAGAEKERILLPNQARSGIYHAEILPFLATCMKRQLSAIKLVVFDPRVCLLLATDITSEGHGLWRCSNDIRELMIINDNNHMKSIVEIISGVKKEFVSDEEFSEKVTN